MEYLFSPLVTLAPRAPHAFGFILSPAFLPIWVAWFYVVLCRFPGRRD
jgi:hypothetical protein